MASMGRTLTRLRSQANVRDGACAVTSIRSSIRPRPFSTSDVEVHGARKVEGSSWSKWLLFIPGAVTFCLGTWQIWRRQDKIKMLEHRQCRLAMEPLKLNFMSPSPTKGQLVDLEFRRVISKGVFDDKKSIYLGPRSRSISGVTENGYFLITPLMPISNSHDSLESPILVNRGWVPRSWKERLSEASRDDKQPSGAVAPASLQENKHSPWWWRFWSTKPNTHEEQICRDDIVEVIGVVRGGENPTIFVPDNDPSSSQWFYVDVPAMARACGLPESTLYVENANEHVDPSNPYPLPKDLKSFICTSVMPQDHLNYTLTWYSLSAAVTFMAFKKLKPGKRRSKAAGQC